MNFSLTFSCRDGISLSVRPQLPLWQRNSLHGCILSRRWLRLGNKISPHHGILSSVRKQNISIRNHFKHISIQAFQKQIIFSNSYYIKCQNIVNCCQSLYYIYCSLCTPTHCLGTLLQQNYFLLKHLFRLGYSVFVQFSIEILLLSLCSNTIFLDSWLLSVVYKYIQKGTLLQQNYFYKNISVDLGIVFIYFYRYLFTVTLQQYQTHGYCLQCINIKTLTYIVHVMYNKYLEQNSLQYYCMYSQITLALIDTFTCMIKFIVLYIIILWFTKLTVFI